MARRVITLFALHLAALSSAQTVLHYTETSGFDHGTRTVSLAMFQDLATQQGFSVVNDDDGSSFTDPTVLQQFDVIVFANTSGDAILDPTQRANFEQWVADGGHVMGLHAATDTYRHSSANGTNTGVWDFYAELIGASVQQNPNHVSGTPLYAMTHIGTHPSTADLPDPWTKEEEYYYWENGYFGPDDHEVLRVEETIGPNGQVNSYDAPRPVSWYRVLPNGSRVFYTALGHAVTNYTSDTLFRAHISDALAWLLGMVMGVEGFSGPVLEVMPNPASDRITIRQARPGQRLMLHAMTGAVIRTAIASGQTVTIDLAGIADGIYVLRTGYLSGKVIVRR